MGDEWKRPSWFNQWLMPEWWNYLLAPKNNWYDWHEVLWCRLRGHPKAVKWGDGHGYHCNGCGDELE